MVRILVIAVFALALAIGSHAAASDQIEITSPTENAGVPWRACVSGYLATADRPAWLVIHPMETGDHFVQPALSLRGGPNRASFRVQPYFGENTALHVGKRFEFQVVQNPHLVLREGIVLPSFPDADFKSPVVEVIRDDRASSGCGGPPVQTTAATATPPRSSPASNPPTAVPSPIVANHTPSRIDNPRTVDGQASRWTPVIQMLFAATIYLALVLLPKQTTAAVKWLLERIEQAWAVACAGICYLVPPLAHIVPWTWRHSTRGVVAAWNSKGASLTIREIAMLVLTVVPLIVATYLMLIVDARMIMIGLTLVLHADVATAGIITDIVALASTQLPAASPQTIQAALFQPVIMFWNEPLGPAALSLAACHGAFAVVLYSGWNRARALGAGPRSLFRERLLPTIGFLVLNVALAWLAGYRAYEQSPTEMNGSIAFAFAAAVGLSIPWLMALSVHVLTDATADVAGVAGGGVTVAAIVSAMVMATLGVGFAIGLTVVAILAMFVVGVAVMGVALLLLWSALLFGELVTLIVARLRLPQAPQAATPSGLLIAPARVVSIVLLVGLLTSLLLVAAASAAETPTAHDPSKPHKALLLVIDTSLSVQGDQFEKAKQMLHDVVERDVQANDLVWLVVINDGPATARRFPMPFVSNLRSRRDDGAQHLAREKAALTRAIAELRRTSSQSDLSDAIDLSLMVLTTAKRASQLTLIVSSDFIDDTQGRMKTATPRRQTALSAARMQIILLLTRPQPEYIRALRLSQTDLFLRVRDDWTRFFRQAGATTAAAAPIDAYVRLGS